MKCKKQSSVFFRFGFHSRILSCRFMARTRPAETKIFSSIDGSKYPSKKDVYSFKIFYSSVAVRKPVHIFLQDSLGTSIPFLLII